MGNVAAGQIAPEFELKRTDGKSCSLKNALAQGPVLAAFFKVSCPTCQYTFPFIERIHQRFRQKGVQVLGISQDNARDSTKFAREFGVTFPILIDDDDYAISRQYGLTHVPTLFLVAPDGHVEISSDGFSKADLLGMHDWLGKHFSIAVEPLFQPSESVPEYKPG